MKSKYLHGEWKSPLNKTLIKKRYFASILPGSNKDLKWWEPSSCTVRQTEGSKTKNIKDHNFAKWAGKNH